MSLPKRCVFSPELVQKYLGSSNSSCCYFTRFYKAILSVLFDMVVISVGPSLSCAGRGRTTVRQAKSFVPTFRRPSLSGLRRWSLSLCPSRLGRPPLIPVLVLCQILKSLDEISVPNNMNAYGTSDTAVSTCFLYS